MLKLPQFKGKEEKKGNTKGSSAASPTGEVEVTVYDHRGVKQSTYGHAHRPVSRASKADKAALSAALQDKFVKHHVGMPATEDLIDGNNYVVGQDGLYLVRKNSIGLFVTKADKIPFIDDDRNPVEGFHMALEKKLPYEMLLQTVSFFRKVIAEKGNAEAMIQVFLKDSEENPDYFMHIADQEVSGAFVKFKRDSDLEDANMLILDIHSHNTMGAFFSGTDNADEKEARVYGVIGKLNQEWPEMKFRAGDGTGKWIELNMFDVFETPDTDIAIPSEWMAKVHRPGSGIFGEHSKPKTTFPQSPYGSREVYTPGRGWERRPWDTGGFPRVRRFGSAGQSNQDMLEEYDWGRWEEESKTEGETIDYPELDFEHYHIDAGIEMLIEGSETLDKDEVKAMWLTLIEKLDPIAMDELADALKEKL